MSSLTAIEEKSCDSRRSHTKGDLALYTNGGSDGVGDMGLSTTSCAEKEKQLSPVVVGRVHDLVKCVLLFQIKIGIIVLDPLSQLDGIISQLLSKDRVVNFRPPLLLRGVHVLNLRKTLSICLYGELLKELKAI